MRRANPAAALLAAGALAACGTPHPGAPEAPGAFAAAAVEQARARSVAAPADEAIGDGPYADLEALRAAAARRFDEAAALRGVAPPPSAELRARAADPTARAELLQGGLTPEAIVQLLWLRSPALEARREALAGRLQGYDQVRFLEDVVARFRAFTRETRVRVGPPAAAGSRARQAQLAPYPSVEALRSELVERGVEEAWHELRAELTSLAARALRLRAELLRNDHERRLTAAHRALVAELEPVARALLASSTGASQADLLTLEAELGRLDAELFALTEEGRGLRAELGALLDLEPNTALTLADPVPAAASAPDPGAADEAAALARLALENEPRLFAARARARRAEAALRLGEQMTLGPVDLGFSRFERDLAGETGGPPAPVAPLSLAPRPDPRRSGQGAAEALLGEMRHRVSDLQQAVRAAEREDAARAAAGLAGRRAALERRRVHEAELLPLARLAYDGLRASYAGGGASFLEVYRAARRLLELDLGRVHALRDQRLAEAALLEATGTLTSTL